MQKHFMLPHPCDRGYVMLLAVLITTAVGAGLAATLLLLGVGTTRTSFVAQQSAQARFLANACAEEALQKLRESIYYTGNETVSFSNGLCEIQTVSGIGNMNRIIQAQGTVGAVVRKVTVSVAQVHPEIVISSWLEVGDF